MSKSFAPPLEQVDQIYDHRPPNCWLLTCKRRESVGTLSGVASLLARWLVLQPRFMDHAGKALYGVGIWAQVARMTAEDIRQKGSGCGSLLRKKISRSLGTCSENPFIIDRIYRVLNLAPEQSGEYHLHIVKLDFIIWNHGEALVCRNHWLCAPHPQKQRTSGLWWSDEFDRDYIEETAIAHEEAGFDQVLVGTGILGGRGRTGNCQPCACGGRKKLKVLVAHRPGFVPADGRRTPNF